VGAEGTLLLLQKIQDNNTQPKREMQNSRLDSMYNCRINDTDTPETWCFYREASIEIAIAKLSIQWMWEALLSDGSRDINWTTWHWFFSRI